MADSKISALTDGTTPQSTDEFVVARGADNRKLTWSSMLSSAQSGAVLVGAAAGGVLSGTYPNPGFAVDMATQAELDAHINDPTDAHLGTAIGNTPAGGIAATTVQAAINELDTEKPATGTVVLKSLYDANTVLAANTDDTPAALTMGASTILARLAAGNIVAATPAQLKTLLGLDLASASYKRTAGNYTTASTSFVDVDATNLALTITTGARRVLITVVGVAYNDSGSLQNVSFDVDLDGARLGGTSGMTLIESVSSGQRLVNISYVTDALSAASHTFKLQWATTAGNATLRGTSAGYTLRFAVVELAS